MNASRVSVVIPTFNGARYIEQTVQSVFKQSIPPMEIVVVDDCSTDNTVEVVERIARDSPVPIQIIRLNSNSGGPARPMNVGIEAVQGELLAMLDQDDLMCSDRIAASLAALQKYPDASFVMGESVLFDEDGFIEGSHCSKMCPEISGVEFSDEPCMAFLKSQPWKKYFFTNPGIQRSCSNHFFSKSNWRKVGGYREEAKASSDYDFAMRAFGPGIIWLKGCVFEKRVHGDNFYTGSIDQRLRLIRLQQEIATFDNSRELRSACNELTRHAAQRMRWASRYKESRVLAIQLLKYGNWGGAVTELVKSTALSLFRN